MTDMRSKYSIAFVVLATALAAGVGHTVVTAQAKKTVWAGVYTAEQATRGKATAAQQCEACHGGGLAGGDLAPTLVGNDFISHWYDAKLSELSDKITQTMPANAPGSLKPEEFADILAFMLQASGMPAGQDALKIDKPTLDAIMIVKQP